MTGPVKNETKFAEVKVTSNLNYRFDSSSRPNLASSRLTSNIE